MAACMNGHPRQLLEQNPGKIAMVEDTAKTCPVQTKHMMLFILSKAAAFKSWTSVPPSFYSSIRKDPILLKDLILEAEKIEVWRNDFTDCLRRKSLYESLRKRKKVKLRRQIPCKAKSRRDQNMRGISNRNMPL